MSGDNKEFVEGPVSLDEHWDNLSDFVKANVNFQVNMIYGSREKLHEIAEEMAADNSTRAVGCDPLVACFLSGVMTTLCGQAQETERMMKEAAKDIAMQQEPKNVN